MQPLLFRTLFSLLMLVPLCTLCAGADVTGMQIPSTRPAHPRIIQSPVDDPASRSPFRYIIFSNELRDGGQPATDENMATHRILDVLLDAHGFSESNLK